MNAVPIGPACPDCGGIDGHRKWCDEARWELRVPIPSFGPTIPPGSVHIVMKRYEPMVRLMARIDEITMAGPGQATVPRLMKELKMTSTTTRRWLRWLLDAGFIERVPAEYGRAWFAYKSVRKS